MFDRDKRILIMFNSGLAPSEIDKRMRLVRGSARSVIVSAWAYDKENSRREKADMESTLRMEDE